MNFAQKFTYRRHVKTPEKRTLATNHWAWRKRKAGRKLFFKTRNDIEKLAELWGR